MSKLLDVSPISVQRIRRSNRVEIFYNNDGTLNRVVAHRVFVVQQAGADITDPIYFASIEFPNAIIPAAVRTQLLALATLIDNNDP